MQGNLYKVSLKAEIHLVICHRKGADVIKSIIMCDLHDNLYIYYLLNIF